MKAKVCDIVECEVTDNHSGKIIANLICKILVVWSGKEESYLAEVLEEKVAKRDLFQESNFVIYKLSAHEANVLENYASPLLTITLPGLCNQAIEKTVCELFENEIVEVIPA